MEIKTRCSAASTVPLQTTRRDRTVRSRDVRRRYECMEVKRVATLSHVRNKGKKATNWVAITRPANLSNSINRLWIKQSCQGRTAVPLKARDAHILVF